MLHESLSGTNEALLSDFKWDNQSKSLFCLFRVIISFLWMFFCRDQYRRAAHDFGQAVIGRSDIADEFDSYFNPSGAAGDLIEQIARLYQFSDILGCRNELHRYGFIF